MSKSLRRNPVTGQFMDEQEARDVAEVLASDRRHALETAKSLQADPFYDGPEVIMLSTGYAQVFRDGDVVQHGKAVWSVADELAQHDLPNPNPNPTEAQ